MSLRFQRSPKGMAIGFVLLQLFVLVLPCFSACFLPNGTDRNVVAGVADGYAPCNLSAAVSMCCAFAGSTDKCMPNGLCYNVGNNLYWRESCTDQTWQDPACIKLFVAGADADSDVALTSCSDGSWCKNSAGEACCNAGEGYFIVDGGEATQRPSSSGTSSAMSATVNNIPSSITNQPTAVDLTSQASSPSSSSSSSASFSAASSSASSTASSSSGSSGGLSAGAVSGISIGGTVLTALGVWITWRQLRIMQNRA